jgi:hypothetical protein
MRSDHKEVALDGEQAGTQLLIVADESEGDPQERIEFIYVPIGFDPWGVFGDSAPIE